MTVKRMILLLFQILIVVDIYSGCCWYYLISQDLHFFEFKALLNEIIKNLLQNLRSIQLYDVDSTINILLCFCG